MVLDMICWWRPDINRFRFPCCQIIDLFFFLVWAILLPFLKRLLHVGSPYLVFMVLVMAVSVVFLLFEIFYCWFEWIRCFHIFGHDFENEGQVYICFIVGRSSGLITKLFSFLDDPVKLVLIVYSLLSEGRECSHCLHICDLDLLSKFGQKFFLSFL